MQAFISTTLVRLDIKNPNKVIWWFLSGWRTTPNNVLFHTFWSFFVEFCSFCGRKVNLSLVCWFAPHYSIVNVLGLEIVNYSTVDRGRFNVIDGFLYEALVLCHFVGISLAICIGIMYRTHSASLLWTNVISESSLGHRVVKRRTQCLKMTYTRAHMVLEALLNA